MQKSCTCKRYGLFSPELQILLKCMRPSHCVFTPDDCECNAVGCTLVWNVWRQCHPNTAQSAEIVNLVHKTDMINTIVLHVNSQKTVSHVWKFLICKFLNFGISSRIITHKNYILQKLSKLEPTYNEEIIWRRRRVMQIILKWLIIKDNSLRSKRQ